MRVKEAAANTAAAVVGVCLWAIALLGIAILFGGLVLACF